MYDSKDVKIILNRAGGTAGQNSVRYRIPLPAAWVKQLGVSRETPKLELSFDGETIAIRKKHRVAASDFWASAKAAGHSVKVYRYYYNKTLCSTIYADFTTERVAAENATSEIIHTAFGNNAEPNWNDFLDFLEERCVPRTRIGINNILQEMGLDEYDPIRIVEKTQGRMAEDKQWLSVSEV